MPKIFVTDFDGTMTSRDFYELAIERLIPPGCPNYWHDYRAGRITHFDALNAYFKEIRASENEISGVLKDMQLDPQLVSHVRSLRDKGWRIVVTSAGCQWYIDRLLQEVRDDVEIHANPGDLDPVAGLVMRRPTESPFFSNELGVDKAGIVRYFLSENATVAFAGDGYPDADAARLVQSELRFARSDLAEQLRSEGSTFRSFDVWSDVARQLLQI